MRFSEFQLRVWPGDDGRLSALVHVSPVGDVPRPVASDVTVAELADAAEALERYRLGARAHELLFDVGRRLGRAALPPPVADMLRRSLDRTADGIGGVRLRLCLDPALADLPWETLAWPGGPPSGRRGLLGGHVAWGAGGATSLASFVALDPRVSFVRGAPLLAGRRPAAVGRERLAFVGALDVPGRPGGSTPASSGTCSRARACASPS